MKNLYKFFIILTLVIGIKVQTTNALTTIGVKPLITDGKGNNFQTLKAAFDAINAGTLTGPSHYKY